MNDIQMKIEYTISQYLSKEKKLRKNKGILRTCFCCTIVIEKGLVTSYTST